MEHNLCLTVQYDGGAYVGWQLQPLVQGFTVQYHLEQALAKVYGKEIRLHGAGRTDRGVHAFGQCCSYMTTADIPLTKLPSVINRKLPPDIRVTKAEEKPLAFDARFSAQGKYYRYLLQQGDGVNLFTDRYSWRVKEPLDLAAMREAAQCLLGEHDFRHFTVVGSPVSSYVRTLYRLEITEWEAKDSPLPWSAWTAPLAIHVEGDGFLYKMVRIITGRLVAIGQGKYPPSAMAGFLANGGAQQIPPAPAQGLMLMRVYYDNPWENGQK